VNWVSGDNLLFPKNPRLAGAYAIHDSTISGCNDRFAPGADIPNIANDRFAPEANVGALRVRCASGSLCGAARGDLIRVLPHTPADPPLRPFRREGLDEVVDIAAHQRFRVHA